MTLRAGVGRVCITPFAGVELAGLGYYFHRVWRQVHDDLYATAVVLDDGVKRLALVSLDLMVIDGLIVEPFTEPTRRAIEAATGIPAGHVLLCCTHTHNGPAINGLRGCGQTDALYAQWVSRQTVTAVKLAADHLEPVTAHTAATDLSGHTYNRTRAAGPVDTRLTTLRLDRADGSPLAMPVNFQGHPVVHMKRRMYSVGRDVPGDVCDRIERELPGCHALYLQGAAGDLMFNDAYNQPVHAHRPGDLVAGAALDAQRFATHMPDASLDVATPVARLPTRRWAHDEIFKLREEAEHRLASNDTTAWMQGLGRGMTCNPPDMIDRHGGDEVKAVRAMARFMIEWSDQVLLDWRTRPEHIDAPLQTLRIGELCLASNPTELYSAPAIALRQRVGADRPLMIVGYANYHLGYMPDAHDVAARSYGAYQSPKYCNRFPFTDRSAEALVDGMAAGVDALCPQGV